MSNSVMRGFKDEKGSWKIICISRRIARSSEPWRVAMSTTRPACVRKRTWPEVGSIALITHLAVVVLPQPVSPTMPRVSPSSTWKLTPSTGLHLAADAPYQAPAEREELAEVFDLQQRLVSGLALCGQVLSSVAVEEAAHVVVG